MTNRPATLPLYDWAMALASLWISGGILYDAWHHFHETIETFFETGHAVLYAGLLASFVFTGIAVWYNSRRGYTWRDALPRGYETTLAGLGVFLLGGVLDLIKHTLWGFEEGFNALVSPSHLVIGAGMFLIIAGPISAALTRKERPQTLLAQLPMIAAAASMMELLHWGTQFVFPSAAEQMNAPLALGAFSHDTLTLLALDYYKQGIGLISVVVQSLLLAGFAIYLARRIRIAAGGYTVLLVLGNVFVAGAQSNYAGQFAAVLLASAAAGICADAIAVGPQSSKRRFVLFSFSIPAAYWIVMLGVLAATMGGLWWTPDIISGSVLFAGLSGLFLNAVASRTEDSDPRRA
ncbi:MAG: hypothetical protein KGN02_12850 [bacterium]|nr:hypothetical protein [bacterium]